MTRYPLLLIAAAFAAGIAAAPYFYLTATEQIVLLTLATLAAGLLFRAGRHAPSLFCCWLGFFLCGTFLAGAEHAYLASRPAANHLELLARQGRLRPEEPLELIGWSRTPSERRPGSETFDLEVTEVRQSSATLPTHGAVRVYYFQEPADLLGPGELPDPGLQPDKPASLNIAYGMRLAVSLQDLRRPRNFLTPDSFDWEAWMRRQNISFTGLVREPTNVIVLPGRAGSRWRRAVHGLRARLLAQLDRLYMRDGALSDRGAILKAMLLGDDNWLSLPAEAAFQNSGTYHVLVVSGWNVVALTGVLFFLLRWTRIPETIGIPLVAVAVAGFVLLTGSGIAVFRAALMCLLYLVARLFYRERAALNSIAAAALILLLLHPSDLWNGGFQLSFFAVLVLAGVAVPLAAWVATPYRQALRHLDDREQDRHLEPRQIQFRTDIRVLLDFLCAPAKLAQRGWRWLRSGLGYAAYSTLAISEAVLFNVVMQIGFAIAIAIYFRRVVWSGVFTNLLILPLTGILTSLGLPLLLLSQAWQPLETAAGALLGGAVAALQTIVEWGAAISYLNRRVPAPPPWLALTFFALLVAAAALAARRSRWTWACGGALAALCILLTLAPYPERLSPGRLEVSVLDVGQGDSILVSFPEGSTMLVDGGGAIPIPGAPPPRLDVGESVISSYLWSRGIQRLDTVVLTHDHYDHFGGLDAVLRNFRVGELWMGPDPEDRPMDRLRAVAASRGTRSVIIEDGITRMMDGVEVEVLSPPQGWAPRRVSNDDSIVLRLSYEGRRILLPGDVEARMERRLVEGGAELSSEVLKVAHHGSRTSSTPEFLSRVAPHFGIISVGAYKRFGHPTDDVLAALAAAGVRVYRTDRDGTVTISTDGHRLDITTHRDTLRPWPPFVRSEAEPPFGPGSGP